MKIASFNVNSVRMRIDILLQWLQENKPDLLLLQELKCQNEQFPLLDFSAIGYHVHVHGQKSYNGVAAISAKPMRLASTKLAGDESDEQARWIEVIDENDIRFIGIYAPNGNPKASEKFTYKLSWLKRLERRVEELLAAQEAFLIAGDFNIVADERDTFSVEHIKNDALYDPQSQAVYWRLVNNLMCDAWRHKHPNEHGYTYWDYFASRFAGDQGLRIDHILLSPRLADRLSDCYIDSKPRAMEKPSDHTPIIVELK